MDPEQEINAYLRTKGVQHAVVKDMLNGFAHDLAEAIRVEARERYADDPSMGDEEVGMLAGADLIDPEVRKL